MQKIFVVCLLSLMVAGCNIDSINNAGAQNDATQLTVALPRTRIAMGDKDGDTYPLYWSEGDKIVANGVLSEEVKIDAEDKSCATFEIRSGLSYPCTITCPYTSATTAAAPKVVFPSEQSYVEGSFAEHSVPMCGYVARQGDGVALKHLAGVLKFSVKGDGVVLQKIVVTSTSGAKLAGEFAVDCQTASILATERTQNTITYILPTNFVLSATEASEFYISIPAVEVGNCTVELVESSGSKMVCKWNPSTAVKSGVVKEFKPLTYAVNTVVTLESLEIPSFSNDGASRLFKIRAMSYNVRNCKGLDDVVDYERVGKVIADMNAEVVAVQELDSMTTRYPGQDVLKNLADYTGMHSTFGAAISYKGGKYGVGVLSKEKPISYYCVPLPCSSEPRVLLVVEFENYYFCSTHFSLYAEYREQAVNIINEEAKRLKKPFLVAGDFNTRRGSEQMRLMAETFHIFEKRAPIDTFPSDAPTQEIDYICLYTGRSAAATIIDSWVPDIPTLSDHRPTVVEAIICE
ncbi:MAG: endonuclease/exonuclease/phosphatase family protein [Alistipes sp.]|nr:endonuclease/exonuclease/phosphatase family protein [Alistipes sp.]MBP3551117.1 endonuclease/exonuclease/phosphatase family protein [Alistipes sp.]